MVRQGQADGFLPLAKAKAIWSQGDMKGYLLWGREGLLVTISLILSTNLRRESSPASFSGYCSLMCTNEMPGTNSSLSMGPSLSVVGGRAHRWR